jgi:hypothetical protein
MLLLCLLLRLLLVRLLHCSGQYQSLLRLLYCWNAAGASLRYCCCLGQWALD